MCMLRGTQLWRHGLNTFEQTLPLHVWKYYMADHDSIWGFPKMVGFPNNHGFCY